MDDPERGNRAHPPPFEERLVAAVARKDLRPWQIVPDHHRLEDFAQDAALKALQHRAMYPDAFQAPGEIEGFIREEMRRSALNHVTARGLREGAVQRAFVHFESERLAGHERTNPSGPLLEQELKREITAILATMGPRPRQAWNLSQRGDLTPEQAAALMGVAVGSYRRHLVTAHRILRDALRHHRHRGSYINESIPPAKPVRTRSTDDVSPTLDKETLQ